MAKKKKNKIKDFLKKAGMAAAGAMALGALGRRRATDSPGNAAALAKRLMTSDAAYSDQSMPGNLSANMGMNRKEFMPGIQDYYKKGGRVGCGVAKKGFGRALKKGRK